MDFIESIALYAIKYMKTEGILASLTIAQAILESNWGRSELAVNANNLFGIKASLPWVGPKYRKKTKEFMNKKWIEITVEYCYFESVEECIEYRSSIFLKKPRYKRLWGVMDYKEASQIIYECGYATDPNYPQKLIEVIEKYKLYQFDAAVETISRGGIVSNNGEEKMFSPSNRALKEAVSVMLLRLSEEKVHGKGSIDSEWKSKFNQGKLSVSDGLALLYTSMYRGTFDQRDGSDY